MQTLCEMQELLNVARSKAEFDWNYFPVREILPRSGVYAVGARLEFDKSITYISCDQDCTPKSIKILSVK